MQKPTMSLASFSIFDDDFEEKYKQFIKEYWTVELPENFDVYKWGGDYLPSGLPEGYLSKEELAKLDIKLCPNDIKKYFTNKKYMYFMLST